MSQGDVREKEEKPVESFASPSEKPCLLLFFPCVDFIFLPNVSVAASHVPQL